MRTSFKPKLFLAGLFFVVSGLTTFPASANTFYVERSPVVAKDCAALSRNIQSFGSIVSGKAEVNLFRTTAAVGDPLFKLMSNFEGCEKILKFQPDEETIDLNYFIKQLSAEDARSNTFVFVTSLLQEGSECQNIYCILDPLMRLSLAGIPTYIAEAKPHSGAQSLYYLIIGSKAKTLLNEFAYPWMRMTPGQDWKLEVDIDDASKLAVDFEKVQCLTKGSFFAFSQPKISIFADQMETLHTLSRFDEKILFIQKGSPNSINCTPSGANRLPLFEPNRSYSYIAYCGDDKTQWVDMCLAGAKVISEGRQHFTINAQNLNRAERLPASAKAILRTNISQKILSRAEFTSLIKQAVPNLSKDELEALETYFSVAHLQLSKWSPRGQEFMRLVSRKLEEYQVPENAFIPVGQMSILPKR